MAGKHPYISSGGPLVQAITQFRKSIEDDLDTCLGHLTVISALFRRLEEAGYQIAAP